MDDATKEFINAVNRRVALNKQIRGELAAGRNTISSENLADALLKFIEESIADGSIPRDYREDVNRMRRGEEQVRLFTRQAERCESN